MITLKVDSLAVDLIISNSFYFNQRYGLNKGKAMIVESQRLFIMKHASFFVHRGNQVFRHSFPMKGLHAIAECSKSNFFYLFHFLTILYGSLFLSIFMSRTLYDHSRSIKVVFHPLPATIVPLLHCNISLAKYPEGGWGDFFIIQPRAWRVRHEAFLSD